MRTNTLAKLLMFLFASLSVASSFQNCSQTKLATKVSESDSGLSAQESDKISKVDLKQATSLEVQLDSLFTTQLKKEKPNLKINLVNGEMRYVNQDGKHLSAIRFCLYKEELLELKSIIETSKVCQPETRVLASNVCRGDYIHPYAKVQLAFSEVVKLGEKSGCSGIIDLCQENKKALNGYISYLASHLESRKCL